MRFARRESRSPTVPAVAEDPTTGWADSATCGSESTTPWETGYDMRMTLSDPLFEPGPILAPDPADLEVLHEREYRVRAYRFPPGHVAGDGVLIRGAVRDQKPAHLYIAEDPDPLTIHHMQVELHVAFPSMLILEASVLFESHPHDTCGSIADSYKGLKGLSIARGFTHRVRESFGGPRGCTHTTSLLLAMAPVAVQCIWSMQASQSRRTGEPMPGPEELSSAERERRWAATLNSCHVWADDGELVHNLRNGGTVELPVTIKRRFERLGIDPATGRR